MVRVKGGGEGEEDEKEAEQEDEKETRSPVGHFTSGEVIRLTAAREHPISPSPRRD